MDFNDLSIVVRYSGERTYPILMQQLSSLVSSGAILKTVTGNSFEKALHESYTVGLSLNRKKTLIIDSDILLVPQFGRILRGDLDSSKEVLGFSYKLLDKFYYAPKYRGVHIYNTDHLKLGLNEIPEEGSELRPESYVKSRMQDKYGLSWLKKKQIVGIHDFYQFDHHIFDKYVIRAHRSPSDLNTLLENCRKGFVNRQSKLIEHALLSATSINGDEIKNKRGYHKAGNISLRSEKKLSGLFQTFNRVIVLFQLLRYKVLIRYVL